MNTSEMYGKYKIEKREVNGSPVVTIYNTNCKKVYNSIVENYRFKSVEDRDKHITEFKQKIANWEVRKAERKEQKKIERKNFVNTIKIGDILTDSWGYEQTNVEFYKVLSVKGSVIEIKELAHKVVDGSYQPHGMACDVLPSEQFIENAPIIRKIVRSQYIKISDCISLSLWDGRACYKSWYA